ncbi:MAG TPA: 2OG-Fe(II) oxygenase [Steroidobacteraceae bacterium]|nr:2OG-Fe(II) oxygenase [Steroidobacteraceae bacterium]
MTGDVAARVASLDWAGIEASLEEHGVAVTAPLLDGRERSALRGLYAEDARFRSTVVMSHHGFGRGEYRYFDQPLPELVQELRERLYPRLAPVANRWAEQLRDEARFPARLGPFLARCRDAGQTRPTPLLLKYGAGDYNCLHQDLYGEVWFPLQAVFLLSEPGKDFSGGELVLTEQRPRAQSRPHVVPLEAGAAAIFPVRDRPRASVRGHSRVRMRHGVSELRSGSRFSLGIIFHDAR